MSNHMTHSRFMHPPFDRASDALSAVGVLSYADHDNAAPSTIEATLRSPSAAGTKKRKTPKVKGAKQLSRPTSNPQLRDGAMSDSDDKKRNKLGYQRISIACAHCRRRKIRCVLADEDPQQRCQNCIRLKKECVFYPVDQQVAMESRGEPTSKAATGSGTSSQDSSSPSNNGHDRHCDSTCDFPVFSALPSNAPSSYRGLPLEPGGALHAQGAYAQMDYSYRTESDARSWTAPTMLMSTGSSVVSDTADGIPHGYSRLPNGSGGGGDFAPFPTQESMHMSHHPHNANHFDFQNQPRDGMLWQHPQPLRSMSYGHVEHLANNQGVYNAALHSGGQQLSSTAMHYIPSPDVQSASAMSQGTGPQSAPGRPQGPGFDPSPGYPFQQSHGDMENNAVPHSFGGAWYTGHSGFVSLAEEPENYTIAHSQPG